MSNECNFFINLWVEDKSMNPWRTRHSAGFWIRCTNFRTIELYVGKINMKFYLIIFRIFFLIFLGFYITIISQSQHLNNINKILVQTPLLKSCFWSLHIILITGIIFSEFYLKFYINIVSKIKTFGFSVFELLALIFVNISVLIILFFTAGYY